jgi:hypothetical protein
VRRRDNDFELRGQRPARVLHHPRGEGVEPLDLGDRESVLLAEGLDRGEPVPGAGHEELGDLVEDHGLEVQAVQA